MDMESIQTFFTTTVADLAIKVLAAIAFWIVGRWLIGRVIAVMSAAMNRNHIDPTLTKYLGSIISVTLNIALVLGILGYFGIQTTSIAAMLAGAGVAIGVAWSGMLGNFAAGAFMLVLRPIKVGDFVQVGSVDALDAIARFKAAVAKIPNVATDPAPEVNLLDINLVGTVIAVRPYCHTDHYWQVYFDTNEAIVRVCKEAGWPAPTPSQLIKTMAV